MPSSDSLVIGPRGFSLAMAQARYARAARAAGRIGREAACDLHGRRHAGMRAA